MYLEHNSTDQKVIHDLAHHSNALIKHLVLYIYCILHGRIKGFTSAITAIMCQMVVIELWCGSYKTLKVVIEC